MWSWTISSAMTSKHQSSSTDNSRNGYSRKTFKTEDGQFELNSPRDPESVALMPKNKINF